MSSQQTRGVTLTVPAHYFAPVVMLALMWIMRVISTVAPSTVHALGVRAWSPSSLWAIATSPFVHVSWFHLLSNTIPFLILGLIVAFDGAKRFATVTVSQPLLAGSGCSSSIGPEPSRSALPALFSGISATLFCAVSLPAACCARSSTLPSRSL